MDGAPWTKKLVLHRASSEEKVSRSSSSRLPLLAASLPHHRDPTRSNVVVVLRRGNREISHLQKLLRGARKAGFVVTTFYPDDFAWQEQFWYVANFADIFVGVHGMALQMASLMAPCGVLIELRSGSRRPKHPYDVFANTARDSRIHRLIISPSVVTMNETTMQLQKLDSVAIKKAFLKRSFANLHPGFNAQILTYEVREIVKQLVFARDLLRHQICPPFW